MEISSEETLFMPAMVYDELRATLPQLNVVSAAGIVHEIRAVKSPLELDCLRQACAITAEAFEHGFSLVQAGMTEKDTRSEAAVFATALGLGPIKRAGKHKLT